MLAWWTYLSELVMRGDDHFIYNMLIQPGTVIWSALHGACKIHKNVEIGRRAAEKLVY